MTFTNNDIVRIHSLGDGCVYRGIIFGKAPIDSNHNHYIVYMIDKIPGHEKFNCCVMSESCIDYVELI